MKEKFLIIILFLSINVLSQDKKYFDAPFGGGGGYTPGWIFVNLDELNKQLVSFGSGQLSKSGFYTSGGAGFVYIGFVPNLRIGGMGFGGSTSTSAFIGEFEKEAVYKIGGGGVTVEYTLPLVKNMAISVGAVIGGGSIQIELYKNRGNFDWKDLWYQFTKDPSTLNFSRRISNSFFLLSPTLNIDIPFYRFLSFRLGGGYQLAVGKSWKVENEKQLSNVPSKLNGNSFFIQSGIFFGFFSY
ncbi:MAG TPA: hypothetical protein VIH28_04575 [Ignavibacteriaceae bacterium]|uniref:hypothetical protein n=1 Tax=Flavobacterium sp. TaxID=239 RepID=UPI002B4AEB6B|nr:hypothetical protein [Flavobacterium sp.]HLF50872.1 hypothetical protein [Flavobacterium sp.]